MESSGASEISAPSTGKGECSETTVEIKIKTLDSQTYTLRVNKCVPVPTLKEQIENVTGVLSEQQRLICQGKVLKDDQLLSAYHVEDGHTLHLVVRQPVTSSSSSAPSFVGSESVPSNPDANPNHLGRNFVFGTVNLAEHGDPLTPDLSQILSSVISSLGINNIGVGSERGQVPERHGDGGPSDPSQPQIDQLFARAEFDPQQGAFQFSSAFPLGNQPPAVIPDSLTTLSQYLSHLRHEFDVNSRVLSSTSQVSEIRDGESQGHNSHLHSSASQGLPTPSSLAEVMLSTRQLLMELAGECLSELATQLQGQERVTDPQLRANIQTNAVRSGVLFQNLGSLLLELGRTIMTLRMGRSSAQALVNAGPAIFISSSAPNPIMVQAGPSLSGIPMGAIHHGNSLAGGLGSGLLSRNIDIRIRRGQSIPVGTASVAEQSGRQQPSAGRTDPARNTGDNVVHQAIQGELGNATITRESSIRVVPIRTVVAVPARVSRPPSDSSRGAFGLYYNLLARVPQQNPGNTHGVGSPQPSSDRNTGGVDEHPNPGSAFQMTNIESRNADSARNQILLSTSSAPAAVESTQHQQDFHLSSSITSNDTTLVQESLQTGLDSVAHTGAGSSLQETAAGSAPSQTGITTDAEMQEASRQDNSDGLFFSDLIRRLMPFISQTAAVDQSGVSPSNSSSSAEQTERLNLADARNRCDPPDGPASKRPKIE